MKKIIKHWKTSLMGLGSIITGVAFVIKGQINEGITAILTGIGLTSAKDFDKE